MAKEARSSRAQPWGEQDIQVTPGAPWAGPLRGGSGSRGNPLAQQSSPYHLPAGAVPLLGEPLNPSCFTHTTFL